MEIFLIAYATLGTEGSTLLLGSSPYHLAFGRDTRHNVAVTYGRTHDDSEYRYRYTGYGLVKGT